MRVFLDVGAHEGETLRAVVDPRYGFHRIVCFEPVASSRRTLEGLRQDRVAVMPFGLSNTSGRRLIYDPGSVGASVYADKQGTDRSEPADFVRATDWIRQNIGPEDVVFLKLNCEGSECDILDDLLDSGEIKRMHRVLVHFDVRKIPSQRHREAEVRARLDAAGIPYDVADEVMVGPSHVARIQRFLAAAGADQITALGPIHRLRSRIRQVRHRDIPRAVQRLRLGHLLQRVLPRSVYEGLRGWLYPEARERPR